MKTNLFFALSIALWIGLGFQDVNAQPLSKNFLVLTTNDTIQGKVIFKPQRGEKRSYFRVGSRRDGQFFDVEKVSAFRSFGIDYVMRPELHPGDYLPYHAVLANGKVKLFGQWCSSCGGYHTLHVEFEDGRLVCVNKDNYYDKIVPVLCATQECHEKFENKSMRYPFFGDVLVDRLIALVQFYNQSISATEEPVMQD